VGRVAGSARPGYEATRQLGNVNAYSKSLNDCKLDRPLRVDSGLSKLLPDFHLATCYARVKGRVRPGAGIEYGPDERVSVNEVPFPVADWRDDLHWMVKSFFNYVCEQGSLVTVLNVVTQRYGYAYNEEYCVFPDPGDPDPSLHFDGVAFGVSKEEVIITEVECWRYVRQAGLFWIGQNKNDADAVRRILLRIPG